MIPLHKSLKSLSLQPRSNSEELVNQRVLVGKLLTSRSFRHYTITEIALKTWTLKGKLHIEKLEENLCKFSFDSLEDKEKIFKGRPWSFNGAHLTLKEWSEALALSKISFQFSTFTVQIHGLPPLYLHEDTALLIGNHLGKVQREYVDRISVVAQRFLRFKVDIDTRIQF